MRFVLALAVLGLFMAGCSGGSSSGADTDGAVPDTCGAGAADCSGVTADASTPPADGGGDAGGVADAGGVVDAGPEAALAAQVDPENIRNDLDAIAAARPPVSPKWQEVQDLCTQRFKDLGLTVERHSYATGVNIVGVKKGIGPGAGQVLVSAHYDSVSNCPAADDNASGVAGVFEAARVLSSASFERDLVVACWDEEENGLVGSKAYADRAKERGDPITVSLVLEMIGFKSDAEGSQELPPGLDLLFPDQAAWLKRHKNKGDFVAYIADDSARAVWGALEAQSAAIGLPAIVLELSQSMKSSGAAHSLRRSDHDSFWKNGFPAVMITDTSEYRNNNYHCTGGQDTVDTLDPAFAAAIVRATTAAAAAALGLK